MPKARAKLSPPTLSISFIAQRSPWLTRTTYLTKEQVLFFLVKSSNSLQVTATSIGYDPSTMQLLYVEARNAVVGRS